MKLTRFSLPPSKSHLWSLADQALVSGSNFLCGILLARTLGLEAFGAYVIAQTYLLYANTFQGALVVSPMMTAVPAEAVSDTRRLLLRGFFGYTIFVLAVTIVLVQAAAYFLGMWFPAIGLADLAVPLVGAMSAFQLQDWLRRACYSDSETRRVFFGDAIAYGGQLLILLVLAISSRLTAEAALWSMTFAFFVAAFLMLSIMRLFPDKNMALQVMQTHWRASRNFFASWQLQWLASQGVILFGTAMVGQQAAGAIRAAQNLLGPVNVFFQWMDNVVPVRAALRYRDGGSGALGAYLWRLGVVGICALGMFAGVLSLVDEPLIVLLYGEDYRPYAVLVVFQAFYYLFGHAYRMASYFQRAIGETRELAIASVWWAAVAMLVAVLSVGQLADRGIMLALVLGEVAGLVYLLAIRFGRSTAGGTHCVVRRGDGSIQLLLPVLNRRLALSALGMYFPSRWTGRVYRELLRRTLALRLFLGIAELHPPLEKSYPHLEAALASFPGVSPASCGALVGAPGPFSKLTLKLMDASGAVLAYGRLASGEMAMAAIRREATVLGMLKQCADDGMVPKILKSIELEEPRAYFLAESAGPEASAVPMLTENHFAFLSRLIVDGDQAWIEAVSSLRNDIEDLVKGSEAEKLCRDACDLAMSAPLTRLPISIEHGDFTPWNIRQAKDGGLFFIDWEHARSTGLPWMDALHFVYQLEVLVHRSPPSRVVQVLLNAFSLEAGQSYAGRCPVKPGLEPAFAIAYLLRMLLVSAAEGAPLSAKQQLTRLLVLENLLQECHWGNDD